MCELGIFTLVLTRASCYVHKRMKRPPHFYKLSFFAVSCGVLIGAILYLRQDLPEVEDLLFRHSSGAIRIYSSDGTVVSRDLPQARIHLTAAQIPKKVIWAFLAAEDHRFYEHVGLDLTGILRAVFQDVISRRFVQGGSTITQQLAKVLFLTPERSFRRKLREAMLAVQIERRFSKDQILEIYLNTIYLGRGAYGIAAAARNFFNKRVEELSLGEMAFLAALPKAPTAYSSDQNRSLVLERRNAILESMVNLAVITPTEAEMAKERPLTFFETEQGIESVSYFVDVVHAEIERMFKDGTLSEAKAKRGLDVHTTLDLAWQKAASQAVRLAMDNLKSPSVPQASLTVLDNQTGAVRVIQGGVDYVASPYNRAFYAKRQVGSSFKPFVYAYAIEKGETQLSKIWDLPEEYSYRVDDGAGARRVQWKPENYDKKYLGRITLREALANSKNLATIKLVEQLGIGGVRKFLEERFFPDLEIPPELTIALGVVEMSLVQLTNAFRVFPNAGVSSEPYFISMIANAEGEVLYVHPLKPRRVITPQTAYIMVDMLRGVVQEGTGWRARELTCDVGVKTGTTNDYRDAYYLGVLPHVSVGVWVGHDDNRSLGEGETGSAAAGPIWVNFVKRICDQTVFARPPGVSEISASLETGNACSPGKKVAVKMTDDIPRKCPDEQMPYQNRDGEFVYHYE